MESAQQHIIRGCQGHAWHDKGVSKLCINARGGTTTYYIYKGVRYTYEMRDEEMRLITSLTITPLMHYVLNLISRQSCDQVHTWHDEMTLSIESVLSVSGMSQYNKSHYALTFWS